MNPSNHLGGIRGEQMSIQVMDTSRQGTLLHHVEAIGKLDAATLDALVELARQLHNQPLLPILGAGASYDCGVRLAKELSRELFRDYQANPAYAEHDKTIREEDLAEVAEAIRVKSNQVQVVKDLGFPEEERWRPAAEMGEHFCVYCVLARLAKERLVRETIGFNYDCGAEAGLHAEGFTDEESEEGNGFPTHARVVADAQADVELKMPGAFKLFKAHGCAVRYREVAISDAERAAEGIVVCKSQLDGWGDATSGWIHDSIQDRAKNHILLFVGFSAQDGRFSAKLRDVLQHVYEQLPPDGMPRVVAIDVYPEKSTIQNLIQVGLGGVEAEDAVTQVRVSEGSTATAALLVLLTEILALEISSALTAASFDLPQSIDERIAALVAAAPTMARWSYALRSTGEDDYIQRANLMSQRGYVPLNESPRMTVRLIHARAEMRRRLGLSQSESSREALKNDGFVVHQGVAYLPVGIDHKTLVATCPQGQELEKVRNALPHPNLDCVLITGGGSELQGISLKTGEEAKVDWVG
jgi:hypothetical protein